MTDDYEIVQKFIRILNEHTSKVTGWPLHRIVRTGNGRTKRWRTSREKHDRWFHRKFFATDLLRPNLRPWEFKDDGLITYEEYYRDFYKTDHGFTVAVRKEFLLKALALGYVE